MHVSVTVNWCAHTARRKRTHGAKRSINLLQKDTKYIFLLVVVLWSVDLLSDHCRKSKILSTGVRYEGIFYSPKKRIPQLSYCREWENVNYVNCIGQQGTQVYLMQCFRLISTLLIRLQNWNMSLERLVLLVFLQLIGLGIHIRMHNKIIRACSQLHKMLIICLCDTYTKYINTIHSQWQMCFYITSHIQ